MNDSPTAMAFLRMFWAWAWVGVSAMTPLQAVQFVAAIAATVYSVYQTYLLWKSQGKGRRSRK